MPREKINILEETMDYTIVSGDTLSALSKQLNIPLARLFYLNRGINPNILRIGQKIKVPRREEFIREQKFIPFSGIKEEQDKLNILPFDQMIHGYHIRNNSDQVYVIEDKIKHTINVYKRGKLLFSCATNTGLSGEDYLTKTYTDSRGHLKNNAGNMSTPAGIFHISGVGNYKGSPAFTRANKNGDIPSSIHEFSILGTGVGRGNISNGCTRVKSDDLKKLALYIGTGTQVYILPEKEGSRFFIRNGEINFSADTPYGGIDGGGKKGMRDYSIHTPSVTKDIQIQSDGFARRKELVLSGTNSIDGIGGGEERKEVDTDYGKFVSTIESMKGEIQRAIGINNDTYNDIAKLACAVALQESKFGESKRYKMKNMLGDGIQDYFQKGRKYAREVGWGSGAITAGFAGILAEINGTLDTEANSKGLAQVKIDGIFAGKNEKVKSLFTSYGINRDSITIPEKSAIAVMILLASMYVHEVPGLRPKLKQLGLSDIDALIYMNQGKKGEITKGTATPDKNQYLQRIHTGMKQFEILQKEEIIRKKSL